MSETSPTAYPPLPSGNDPAVLPSLPRWNWGAFFFGWIWALGHRMYVVAIVSAVPGAAIVIAVIGNGLAWKYRPFRDLEEFRQVQAAWRHAAFILLAIGAAVAWVLYFLNGPHPFR